MNPYTENVKRGAALLDKEQPGWRDKIDGSRLDLSNGCLCILGQIFGHYDSGLYALWHIDTEQYDFYEWVATSEFQTAVAHGFTIDFNTAHVVSDYDEDTEWQILQEAWIAKLASDLDENATATQA